MFTGAITWSPRLLEHFRIHVWPNNIATSTCPSWQPVPQQQLSRDTKFTSDMTRCNQSNCKSIGHQVHWKRIITFHCWHKLLFSFFASVCRQNSVKLVNCFITMVCLKEEEEHPLSTVFNRCQELLAHLLTWPYKADT